MRFFDLVLLILDNLGRRKARVVLTAIGVVIGTAAVVVLVSLAIGLQQNATQSLYGIGDLTQIQVYPTYGEFTESRGMVGMASDSPTQTTLITNDTLEQFAAIPGVVAVIPRDYLYGSATLRYNRLETYANIVGVGATALEFIGVNLEGGEYTLEGGP